MGTTKNTPAMYREIRELTEEIVQRWGPMLGRMDLAGELGVSDKRTAIRWARDHEVPGVQVGRRIQYEAKMVARAIVQSRGMC